MKAYIFPGQGSQYPSMGKELFENYPLAKELFKKANQLLGFDIMHIMFNGTDEELKMTKVTQPAIFLHSVLAYKLLNDGAPNAVAGHSLGEFSALVANETLSFEDALILVSKRALAMQKACELNPSGMAVVMGFDDEKTKEICTSINEVVVPANYNCPGQLVISGTFKGIEKATELLKQAGAKRVLPLKVSGAFHSPLMESAQEELAQAIHTTEFKTPLCPIYQNTTALPASNPEIIKKNLIAQLTTPVLWKKTIQNMVNDGFDYFIEFGPGEVLQGLVKKIYSEAKTEGKK